MFPSFPFRDHVGFCIGGVGLEMSKIQVFNFLFGVSGHVCGKFGWGRFGGFGDIGRKEEKD